MSLSFDAEPLPPSPETRQPGPLALLLGIWFRPLRSLLAVAERGGWLWLPPLLLAVVLLIARVLIGAPLESEARMAQMRAQMEAQRAEMMKNLPPGAPQPPEEAFEVPELPRALIVGPQLVGGLLGLIFGWLVRAGLLHVACLALGGQQRFGQLFNTTAWASFPLILRDGVQAAYMALTREVIKGPGLSGLLPPPEDPFAPNRNPLAPLLARVDLYNLWYVILLGMAIAVSACLSRGKATLVTVGYILLALGASVVPTLVMRAFTGGNLGVAF